jgi:hypothetical protein
VGKRQFQVVLAIGTLMRERIDAESIGVHLVQPITLAPNTTAAQMFVPSFAMNGGPQTTAPLSAMRSDSIAHARKQNSDCDTLDDPVQRFQARVGAETVLGFSLAWSGGYIGQAAGTLIGGLAGTLLGPGVGTLAGEILGGAAGEFVGVVGGAACGVNLGAQAARDNMV